MNSLIRKLFKPNRLSKEAFDAYINRFPKNINVSWFRSGKFIIGEVRADNYKYMTQAKSATEFVEMVNDALLAAYEVPKDYLGVVSNAKMYRPKEKELEKLNNVAIKKSTFKSSRQETEFKKVAA